MAHTFFFGLSNETDNKKTERLNKTAHAHAHRSAPHLLQAVEDRGLTRAVRLGRPLGDHERRLDADLGGLLLLRGYRADRFLGAPYGPRVLAL